jgi:putative oxidoreductase
MVLWVGKENSLLEGVKMNIPFLLGRVIVGAFYMYNGINHFIKLGQMTDYARFKGVPMPQVVVIGAGVLLLIGGVTIILGRFPEIGVSALILFFIPVSVMMHNFWAVAKEMKAMEQVNFLKNMALLGSALMFLAIKKPWPLSVGNSKK